jgi:hypothetical protein
MIPAVRAFLAGLCCATIAASCWLATMFLILHRAGYQRGMTLAMFFVLQGVLTLAVLAGWLASAPVRVLSLIGAGGTVVAGATAVAGNLSGPHFEGYALVIGAALVVQGALTLGLFASGGFGPWAKVHQFGD